MTLNDFKLELKQIDTNLDIRTNDNVKQIVLDRYPEIAKLASITYFGVDICSIPNGEIYDSKNFSYGVDLMGDGRFVAHRTRPEALEMVKQKLGQIKNDKDYADAFFGRNDYSTASLNKPDVEPDMVIEQVKENVQEVKSNLIPAENEH